MLQLQNGTDQLSGGLVQFNDEGISQLTGALDADQLHALQTVVEEMTGRLADYTSFAGAPEGASSRVKFLYKTAETPAETAPVETAADTCFGGELLPPPVAPPAGPVRALNRQDHVSRPGPRSPERSRPGLCLCSILKTAVDYLWQFTKNKRPLDKYIGGTLEKDRLLQGQQAGCSPV